MTETPNPNLIDADTLTGGLRPIRRVVLALGSNLGDRAANLQGAVNALEDTPGLEIVGVSPLYENPSVDGPDDAPDFLNAVVVADSTQSARTLLERALAIEDAFGRTREQRGAPRTLDVDVVIVGDRVIDETDFQLPHPHAHLRPFVLVPWAAVDPDGKIPGHGRIADLIPSLELGRLAEVTGMELRVDE